MTLQLLKKLTITLVCSQLIVFGALAKNIDQCGKRGPSKNAGEYDQFRIAKVNVVQKIGLRAFNNNEKILPKVSDGEIYYEFDLGRDGFGGRGTHRAVILVQVGSKNKILESYFTQDHYKTFCII